MKPYYEDGAVSVYEADALDLLASLADGSVSLVATDPPYFRVKDEAWDRAWPNERAYLRWIGQLCREWRRVLAPNGSLYVFASPQMAHAVERVVRRSFRVLTDIRWRKPPFSTKAEMFEKDDLRAPFPASETILFCEQKHMHALPAFMRNARESAGLSFATVGRMLGCNSRLVDKWETERGVRDACEPTPAQFQAAMNLYGMTADFLQHFRPFNASPDAPYTDVWDFPTVAQYPGKHPCEKPLAMMEHIVRLSSRPGDVVLDTFSGSGATAEAARNLGRRAIVGDSDPRWVRFTAERVSQGTLLLDGAA